MQPLRVAVLTSRSAPGVAPLLDDPNRGVTWELALVHADRDLAEPLALAEPHYIFLCDYRYEIPKPLLAQFDRKILVLHENTRDAVLSGDSETRSWMSIAGGPLFLLGPRYPLAPMALDALERGDDDFLELYADLHRTWMIATSWGDLLVRSLELLAGGTVQIIGDTVWIDGAPGPCRMGHAPNACYEPETMLARGIPRSCPFID